MPGDGVRHAQASDRPSPHGAISSQRSRRRRRRGRGDRLLAASGPACPPSGRTGRHGSGRYPAYWGSISDRRGIPGTRARRHRLRRRMMLGIGALSLIGSPRPSRRRRGRATGPRWSVRAGRTSRPAPGSSGRPGRGRARVAARSEPEIRTSSGAKGITRSGRGASAAAIPSGVPPWSMALAATSASFTAEMQAPSSTASTRSRPGSRRRKASRAEACEESGRSQPCAASSRRSRSSSSDKDTSAGAREAK